MPYPLPLTRTEAYLAYKAGVIQQSDLKPSLAVPRNGIDAWLAYWTGLSFSYPVKNVGKNILSSSWEGGAYSASTGEKISASGYRTADKISVKPNTAYIVSRDSTGVAMFVGLYKNDGTFITRLVVNADTSFSTSSDTAYITMWRNTTGGIEKMMLEEGESISQYEAYTGEPKTLQEEEAYIAYLCGVINEYPENALRRVGAYLRYLISARWGRPDHPLNREELYLSLLKTQVIPSGDPSSDITIDGTAKAPFIDVKMYGDTAQQSYTGKNLFDSSLTMIQGFVSNAGNVETNTTSSIMSEEYIPVSADTNYMFSLIPQIDNTCVRNVAYYDGSKAFISRAQNTNYVNPFNITTPSGCAYIRFDFYNANGMTPDNPLSTYLTDCQLEKGSSVTSYEPYVGGQPSPSPDYPQAVNTVTGRQVVKVEGKNLFNMGTTSNRGVDLTYDAETGKMSFSGTPTGTWEIFTPPESIKIPAGEYTISIQESLPFIIGLGFTTAGGTRTTKNITAGSTSYTFTIAEESTLDLAIASLTSGVYMSAEVFFQLEKGSSATDYEPYQGQSYEINLGKNLFDKNNYDSLDAYVNGSIITASANNKLVWIPCEPNTAYAVTVVGSNISTGVYSAPDEPVVGGTANWLGSVAIGDTTGVFTTKPTAKYIVVRIWNNTASQTVQEALDALQIERGSEATPYAPYFEPIELCKLGDYQDYIYKDGSDWKVHKAIVKAALDGSEDWSKSSNANPFYVANIYNKIGACKQATSPASALFSHFTTVGIYSGDTNLGACVLADVPNNVANIRARLSDMSGSSSSFKTMLSEKRPVLYARKDTATDTIITDTNLIAQLEALVNGGAEDGTTYIKVNATDPNLPGLLVVEAPKYE